MFNRFALGAALVLLPITSQAAVTLTINTQAQTVTWDGTATSSTIFSGAFSVNLNVIVATAHTPNPNGPTPYVQLGTDGLVMTSHTTTIDPMDGIVNPGTPRMFVDGTNGLVSVIVASVIDIPGGGESTVTVTGDFNPYSLRW